MTDTSRAICVQLKHLAEQMTDIGCDMDDDSQEPVVRENVRRLRRARDEVDEIRSQIEVQSDAS